jgi:hypothetical protein
MTLQLGALRDALLDAGAALIPILGEDDSGGFPNRRGSDSYGEEEIRHADTAPYRFRCVANA